MCGIYASVGAGAAAPMTPYLRTQLRSRGPDHVGEFSTVLAGDVHVSMVSSVLALRGASVTKQPLTRGADCALCWNGEAWLLGDRALGDHTHEPTHEQTQDQQTDPRTDRQPDGGPRTATARMTEEHGPKTDRQTTVNDGQLLFDRLSAARSKEDVLETLRSIEGPFAFAYFCRLAGEACPLLVYGRDRLGRRSLVRKRTPSGLVLCSVCDQPDTTDPDAWSEVEADGLYVMRLDTLEIERVDWVEDTENMISGIGTFNKRLPGQPSTHATASDLESPSTVPLPTPAHKNGTGVSARDSRMSRPAGELHRHLLRSLRLRVLDIPPPPGPSRDVARLAVLFSGGLDCTVLAYLCGEILPADAKIDLINVAFENPRVVAHLSAKSRGEPVDCYELCPDRITGRQSFAELTACLPERQYRFLAVNVSYEEMLQHRPTVIRLMQPHHTEMDLSISLALYFASRGLGIPTSVTRRTKDDDVTAGGDHEGRENSEDLENCKGQANDGSDSSAMIRSLVDPSVADQHPADQHPTDQHPTDQRQDHSQDQTSVDPGHQDRVRVQARVLLSGLGADELFGGYSRHGVAYARKGYAGLVDELLLDIARLGRRNLGRDDRVLSYWGREVRFPFLDETLVRWAMACPVEDKCDFGAEGSEDGDTGDNQDGGPGGSEDVEAAKRVLREVADGLGLRRAAREKKRAIQFGARTAKMDGNRVRGTQHVV